MVAEVKGRARVEAKAGDIKFVEEAGGVGTHKLPCFFPRIPVFSSFVDPPQVAVHLIYCGCISHWCRRRCPVVCVALFGQLSVVAEKQSMCESK